MRYHWDAQTGQLVEGPAPSRVAGHGAGALFNDRSYSDKPFLAHDGTLIDSRAKHRAYMQRHNLTTIDDYRQTWDGKRKQREAFYTGNDPALRRERRQDIARVLEQRHARSR